MTELLTAVISCIIGIIIGYFLSQKFQIKPKQTNTQQLKKDINQHFNFPKDMNIPSNYGEPPEWVYLK